MRKFSKKQYLAAGVAAAIITAGAGAAYAYWTTNGSGTGSASTTSGVASGIVLSGDVANAMYPGDSAQTITVTAANNSGQAAYVTGVSAYLTVTKATDAPAGTCDSSDYLINDNAAPGDAAHAVALHWIAQEIADGGTATDTYTIQFNDKTTNQDGCKGASVTVNYLSN